MTDVQQLSFRKSANIERVTDKRKDSLFRLVDTDGSGTIDAQEFAVLYDAIKKDLAEELEKEAALEKEASSARRRFKMLLLFVAVLTSFLAASVAANFAVIFTVVDEAITTTTTSSGPLVVKGSDVIAKTAVATQDLPLMAAPVLDMETLSNVKSLKVTYSLGGISNTMADLSVVGVRKHNMTFVEFITDVPGETVEALNGVASLVRYPTLANGQSKIKKYTVCSGNVTCSAFRASGVDAAAALDLAKAELENIGFHDAARRLQYLDSSSCGSSGVWTHTTSGNYPAGSWQIKKLRILFYTAYSSTRNVVFFLHGVDSGFGQMWDIFCDSSSSSASTCSLLTVNEFRHLVFVFPRSDIMFAGMTSWSNNNYDPDEYVWGNHALASLKCGTSGWGTAPNWVIAWQDCSNGQGYLNTFTFASGTTLNVDASSDVMMIGYSNGGAMAAFASFVSGTKVSKAVAIDYHPWHSHSWITDPTGDLATQAGTASPGDGLALKIYYSCDSTWYSTNLVGWATPNVNFQVESGMATAPVTAPTPTLVDYGKIQAGVYTAGNSKTFREYTWSTSTQYLKYIVHGLDSDDANGQCTSATIPSPVHGNMKYYHGALQDIYDWVTAPSPAPLPPSPSPPNAMSPPPSPPPPSPVTPWWVAVEDKICDLIRQGYYANAVHLMFMYGLSPEKIKCVKTFVCDMFKEHGYDYMVDFLISIGLKPEVFDCLYAEKGFCKEFSSQDDQKFYMAEAKKIGLEPMAMPCMAKYAMFLDAGLQKNSQIEKDRYPHFNEIAPAAARATKIRKAGPVKK